MQHYDSQVSVRIHLFFLFFFASLLNSKWENPCLSTRFQSPEKSVCNQDKQFLTSCQMQHVWNNSPALVFKGVDIVQLVPATAWTGTSYLALTRLTRTSNLPELSYFMPDTLWSISFGVLCCSQSCTVYFTVMLHGTTAFHSTQENNSKVSLSPTQLYHETGKMLISKMVNLSQHILCDWNSVSNCCHSGLPGTLSLGAFQEQAPTSCL